MSDRFVTAAIVYSQPELAVLLALFEQEGILVLPHSSRHVSVEWPLTLALGGIRLRIHEEDADRAGELLSGIERSSFRRGIFSDNRLVDAVLVIGLFVVGLFAPPARLPAVYCLDRPAIARPA